MATVERDPSASMLEALVLVAGHYGMHLSREQLRKAYIGPDGKVSQATLLHVAGEKGFRVRAVTLNWQQLLKIGKALPAILCLRDGSARVLVSVQRTTEPPVALLRDPDQPAVLRPFDEIGLAELWDGATILLKPLQGERLDQAMFSFSWLFGQILQERRIFRDIGLAALVLSLFALAPPLIYLVMIDRVLVNQRMSTLIVLSVIVLFILVFDTVFAWLRRYLVAEGTARIDGRLTGYVFDRLLRLPIETFEAMRTGEISYRLNEIWRIRAFLTGQLFGTALDSITLLILLPAMFYMSWQLTLFVLALAILMVVVVVVHLPMVRRAYGRVIRAETAKNTFLIETIYGMRTVKSLALEPLRERGWDARAAEAVRAHRNMQHVANRPQTLQQPLERLTYAGSLLLGGYMALSAPEGAVLAGSLVAFTMLSNRATQPFVQLAALIQQVEEARGAVGMVASIVNIPPEDLRADHGLRPRYRGHISFDNVSFSYAGSQNKALDRVSFEIPEGSVVGVMGRSGSGKTTLTRLMQGLHQEFDGLIKIDGVDIRQMDISHLRANLGVVLQDNFLFSGSVRENIAAARPSATFEEIITAARLAGAEEFIERLPRSYDTFINEGSTNLSGGQRQRIAIARALLVEPPILILDEATSALDPDSEAIINNNLTHIASGRTMVVISHRLTSLVACDMIIVMERGQVYDVGAHAELLQRCDIYRHLWFQQNRHLAPGVSNDRTLSGPQAAD